MAQYDIYRMPGGAGYLLNVQSDLLEGMATRVVVPLMPRDTAPPAADRLNPVFTIGGEDLVLVTQNLAAVPLSILGKAIGGLDAEADAVRNALDMVFVGF
ncbi:plasmid maintenance protein CcdB [Rhodospirillaceae bacterium KN72]|uniref:Toxin CcdB n=1 Tax=Pacificispira spongiicola TaxID=2729598 RepID=A0A7Y0E231_9PROT|nr:CcdB family protein [Pacificispira spongiicola]NMM45776.1 plasmid maintenance protein CcdB [Pacificispira spongiicola]